MSYIHGAIPMAIVALLCLQIILTAWTLWLAGRVRRLSRLASLATKRERAPSAWESRLVATQTDVASLSSSFEKLAGAMTRQNARAVMRERRSQVEDEAPPVGSSKAELRRYYGLQQSGPDFARRQMSLVPPKE